MPAMAIRVGVVWVALCLDDAKENLDDAVADDAPSETRSGRPKQLLPVVQRVVCYVSVGDLVVDALGPQRALPLARGLATHAWCTGDLFEVCPLKNHVHTSLRRRSTGWWRWNLCLWQVCRGRRGWRWSLFSRLSSTAWQWPVKAGRATRNRV